MYLSIMMFTCIKQNLGNSWIHEKVKQQWGWIEKKRHSEKKCVFPEPK